MGVEEREGNGKRRHKKGDLWDNGFMLWVEGWLDEGG